MGRGRQTKAQLLAELNELREKVTTLETTIAKQRAEERQLTDRTQAEQNLPQSNRLYQTVLNTINDGVFLVQEERILFVNTAGARMVNASADALLGKPFVSLVAAESVARVSDYFRYYETYGHRVLPDEISLFTQNSSLRVLAQLQMVRLSYHGQDATLVTLRDITAHKRTEETLKEEAEIAAALARVGQVLITSLETPVVLDRLCRITTEVLGCDCTYAILWNAQKNIAVTIAGYGDSPEQEESMRALPFPIQVFAEKAPGVEGELSIADQPAVITLFQSVGIMAVLFFPFRRGTRIIGALSVGYRRMQTFSPRQRRLARGIAQLASFALANAKLLEELENSNRLKEDFVGTMSHELRTPLHILYGYTELLRDESFGPLTPQQADILTRMDKNVRALTTLINTTLDLSRLQSQRVPLVLQELHMSEFFAELANELPQQNRRTDIEIEWIQGHEVPSFWTDVGKLKIIMKNLLTNALKFTEAGKIRVHVVREGEGITFSVSDTGAGIPAEELPFIFEPFRQGGSFTTRKPGGVGLGLYILKRLLELLGGTVTVESTVGKGSTFHIWIPTNPQTGRQG